MPDIDLGLVAQGTVADASASYGGMVPANAQDENAATAWSSGGNIVGQWLRYTLAHKGTIHNFRLVQSPTMTVRANVVELWKTEDGFSYVLHGTYNTPTADDTVNVGECHGKAFRLLRTSPQTQGWQVHDWYTWGEFDAPPPVIEPGTNIADILDYVWGFAYQEAYAFLVANFPQYNFDAHEAYILAAAAVAISQTGLLRGDLDTLVAEHNPTNQQILDAVTNVDGDLQSGISALAANDNANTAALSALIGSPTPSLATDILEAVADINAHTTAERVNINVATEAARQSIEANDDGNTATINGTTNAARDAVLVDAAAKHSAITSTVTSGLAQQTTDLAGALGTTHDAILAAVQGIPDYTATLDEILTLCQASGADPTTWPGLAGVTLGPPVLVTGPDLIDGPMDGIVVAVSGIPSGQSRQPCDAWTRYKGLAWVTFISDRGDAEQLQQLQFSDAILRPKDMRQAESCAVYCKPGGSLTVRTYTVNP